MDKLLQKEARFWNGVARKYATDTMSDLRGYERTIVAIRDRLQPQDEVIEIGCGTGSTALKLAANVGNYFSTDLSTEMIAISREKMTATKLTNLTFDVGEPVSANWSNGQYDAALALNVLHLVPSLKDTLSAVHRLLKPGGVFISKTPCLKLMNPLIRIAVPVMHALKKAPLVSFLTPEEIENALTSANFEIIERAWHGTRGKDTRPYFVARK